MQLSLFYFTYFLFILLSTADQTEFNNPCPTSRRLLFFGGAFNFPLGEKKSEHISSSSKSTTSPSKHARTEEHSGLTVYIRPQTSTELGHKVRSYTHLLQSKLYTKEERANLKKLQSEKKKQKAHKPLKKKNTTQNKPSISTKSQELVAINDHERDRCRTLLRIDHSNSLIPTKDTKNTKKTKKEKNSIASKVKDVKNEAKKKIKALPINDKQKSKKVKTITTKSKTNTVPNDKKNPTKKPSETKPLTPPPVKEVPIKKPPPPQQQPPPSSPPPTQSSTNTKSKREKQPIIIEEPNEPLDVNELDDIDNDEKNNSVVGRAFHFVKNMFQLSDDILESNYTHEEDDILPSTNEQQHRPSRKLLTINDETSSIIYHDIDDYEFDLYLNELDRKQSIIPSGDLLFTATSISRRQLLSVKTNKPSISSKISNTKEKKASVIKPKVGWAYRYRISRYFADQKMKRTGYSNKATGGGKSKQSEQSFNSKLTNKKTSSLSDSKGSKRKLLELYSDDELSSDNDDINNQDTVNSVSITQEFVPKRQLLASKTIEKHVEESTDDDDDDDDDDNNEEEESSGKDSERRRKKSYEQLTDPAAIVHSYDRGLFKPRVGWQFRYRVSRYIDSLRENIREDQQRLKLGLEAIKRKTPQELSGRRKRVLDKPFAPEVEEASVIEQENKPNVGWRYRYRISKMMAAKKRGDYIDDDEERRKARLAQKKSPQGLGKPTGDDDDECIEWEFDIDPELRKINEEGRRVGWAYRYRIRRKLDELKQKHAETGIPFDIETLGGKRDKKKVIAHKLSPTDEAEEKPKQVEKKAAGWEYRYRISKMREAQKHESFQASKSASKKQVQIPAHERLDPVFAQLTPAERIVGWQYRYRIRRKLDSIKNATIESEGGKRGKKQKQVPEKRTSSKRKQKEVIKKVEESIEKILNIDDIDETPFMEYFRRGSGLVATMRKSICLLPSPVTLAFCNEEDDEDVKQTSTTSTTEIPKHTATKKLRTKKEKSAKQFIQPRSTKLDVAERKSDEIVKSSTKTPAPIIEKPQKKQQRQRILPPPVRRINNEQVKHFDEEEQPIKKVIAVESKKNKNKKRFQIIGKEVKLKHKHSTTAPTPTITTNPPPVVTTTSPTPTATNPPPVVTTSAPIPAATNPPPVVTTASPTPKATNPPPVVTTAPPVVEIPKTTPPPSPVPTHKPKTTPTTTPSPPPVPSPKPKITPTTTPTPLQTIAEVLQEDASSILSSKPIFAEETKEEINEANENIEVTSKTTSAVLSDDTTSSDDDEEDDDDSTSSESDASSTDSGSSSSSGSDSDSSEESEEKDENFDPLALKKMQQFYENAKESVHGVFDLKNDKDSS